MFRLFENVTSLVGNVVKVAVAPIEVVATMANVVVKPLADGAEAVVEEVNSLLKD